MTDLPVLDHNSMSNHPPEYAGFWIRFVASLIDSMMVEIVSYTLAIGLVRDITTFGKTALGINVTNMQGERIGFAQATGRYFAKILLAIILLIGYIMAAFMEYKQALHDIIANALVVKKEFSITLGFHSGASKS